MRTKVELSTFEKGARLSLARASASSKMPYFTVGMQGLVPKEAKGLGTFGITETGFLMYDPEILAKLYVEEAGTVLLHEYLHRYFRHGERFREMVRKGILASGDHQLWNEAADMEINDNLVEAGCPFPRAEVMGGEPVTPQSHGYKPHHTAEEYAAQLKKDNKKPKRPGQGDGESLGACGSAAGNPVQGEPGASDPHARDPVEQEMQRQSDSEKIAKHSKTRGNTPRGIRLTAEAALAPAKVSWADKLRASVTSAIRHKVGQVDYTFSHRSRNQGAFDLHYGEEAPVMPGMWAPIAEIAIVVDTSGSMFNALKTVVEEAAGILQTLGGARVTFIAFDTEVHELKPIKSVGELRASLTGGGGTDFRPAFEALEVMPKKKQPDIVVFFTDGYGAYPESVPPWKHIWVNIDGNIGVDWGTEITLTSEDL